MDNNLEKTIETGVENNSTTEINTEKTTYTIEEVEALLQQETDRRVTSALKKAEKTNLAKIKEAERLASLSEEERSREKIRSLEAELQAREKDIAIRENTIILKDEMSKRNIPTELSSFLVSEDADEMFNNLQIFDKALKNLINAEVAKRISSTTPKAGNTQDLNALTKEKFKNMSLAEQQALYNTDRELYNTLTK